jgi:simple sugar transport system ATP-binding protein
LIATASRNEVDADRLAEWMLGERPPVAHHSPSASGTDVLSARELVVKGERGEIKVDHVTLDAHRSEILGIGGVDGNGQVELAEALAGIRRLSQGTIRSEGCVIYMPPDRHRDGLALEMTVEENLLIEGHRNRTLRSGPFLIGAKIRQWSDGLRRTFQIDTPTVEIQARKLSGGNQQKVIVARALDAQPDILVAVNPTRGLDFKATAFVRREIQVAAERGAAVILFSTDLDELQEVATRTLFMSAGKIAEYLGAVA